MKEYVPGLHSTGDADLFEQLFKDKLKFKDIIHLDFPARSKILFYQKKSNDQPQLKNSRSTSLPAGKCYTTLKLKTIIQ